MRIVKPGSVRVHAVWSNWQKRKAEEEKGKDMQQDRKSLVIVDGASALKDEGNGSSSGEEVGKAHMSNKWNSLYVCSYIHLCTA